jgi:hypothetical protein
VRTPRKFLVSPQISRQAFSARCCNASKSTIGAKYTKVFRCPNSQKSRGLRSGDRAGQSTVPPCPIHISTKIWFTCKWGGAPSCMNHKFCRWWRGLCSRNTDRSSSKKLRYTQSVSLLLKTTGLTKWSSQMPTQASMVTRRWWLDATMVWGLSSAHIWVLRNLTIPFLVNPAYQ